MAPANDKAPALTPEQTKFLAQFADDWHAGRRLLCWAARVIVGIGALAGALAAVLTATTAILGMLKHH